MFVCFSSFLLFSCAFCLSVKKTKREGENSSASSMTKMQRRMLKKFSFFRFHLSRYHLASQRINKIDVKYSFSSCIAHTLTLGEFRLKKKIKVDTNWKHKANSNSGKRTRNKTFCVDAIVNFDRFFWNIFSIQSYFVCASSARPMRTSDRNLDEKTKEKKRKSSLKLHQKTLN